MVGKAAMFALVALVLVVGAAAVQGPRAAAFTALGCALAGATLLVIRRRRSGSG